MHSKCGAFMHFLQNQEIIMVQKLFMNVLIGVTQYESANSSVKDKQKQKYNTKKPRIDAVIFHEMDMSRKLGKRQLLLLSNNSAN